MVILDMRGYKTVNFVDLQEGELFEHPEYECIMMKVSRTGCDECGGFSNAVDLETGTTYGIDGDQLCVPLEGTIEVRNKS